MDKDKKIITLQLETDLLNVLYKVAEDEDRSLSSLIRKIVKKYLKEKEDK